MFYSIAIDSVGNTESTPALPDAHTTISTGSKNSLLEKFLMHPNPNPGLINIYNHRSSPVRFKLLDISGMTIFEKLIVSGNNVVHLNPYKAGMYMSIIENGDGQIIGSEKIVLIK